MLRHILNPSKVGKVEELSAAVESWEEMVRLYESRKRADGSRHQLDDEIKMAVLEYLCPSDIERRLQLNRQRYTGYGDVRSELVTYVETRLGTRLKNFVLSEHETGFLSLAGLTEAGKGGKGESTGSVRFASSPS